MDPLRIDESRKLRGADDVAGANPDPDRDADNYPSPDSYPDRNALRTAY